MERAEFVAGMRRACIERVPFAAGKLGVSERSWLRYLEVLGRERDPRRLRAFQIVLEHKSLPTSGVYPPDPRFYERWSREYVTRVRELDSIGINPDSAADVRELLSHHGIPHDPVIAFRDQEPDRSMPHDESRCWLPALRDRDVLLVSPFADLLAARANEQTFQAVWSRTGKPWFHPRSVQSLEFPYGYLPATWERFPTALDLLAHIEEEIEARDFDVALIGAGGLGVPLAATIKRRGKVAISLGGHIQVLFGVMGGRWRSSPSWQRYLNDAWVDMPEKYRPDPARTVENYW